jgi:hypothetical protein
MYVHACMHFSKTKLRAPPDTVFLFDQEPNARERMAEAVNTVLASVGRLGPGGGVETPRGFDIGGAPCFDDKGGGGALMHAGKHKMGRSRCGVGRSPARRYSGAASCSGNTDGNIDSWLVRPRQIRKPPARPGPLSFLFPSWEGRLDHDHELWSVRSARYPGCNVEQGRRVQSA